ncbi:PAAR domain-containing protein [Roseateles depolymerans]|uniref:Type VI secretion protein n=1 Tax=Roseateles depolymerans TaxID=76731 RepID=A0A0U2U4D0_9BURK|nr:PAAR domain-containing protein [Roseateles depolymerans]ALV07057.1 type VI secretion protein [Roseateles depolymerans]REG20040.1 putative Zn-binding protein involved in type VI secretion [Roseateles depolymerans]
MPPAARITDMHTCPMVTPGLPPVPHVGGPVIGPGVPTVLIGSLPATVVGDTLACVGDTSTGVGPPNKLLMGSTTVMIGSRPAGRMGDATAHGGTITLGLPTVLIGG